jgi:hypothetical protein
MLGYTSSVFPTMYTGDAVFPLVAALMAWSAEPSSVAHRWSGPPAQPLCLIIIWASFHNGLPSFSPDAPLLLSLLSQSVTLSFPVIKFQNPFLLHKLVILLTVKLKLSTEQLRPITVSRNTLRYYFHTRTTPCYNTTAWRLHHRPW